MSDVSRGPLRVGVVGCGPVGRLHAQAVRSFPQAELVGVCDLQVALAQQLAQECGGQVYPSITSLLQSASCEVVFVATPNHRHTEVVAPALMAGCHVFCEKPLATTADEARTLTQLASAHRVQLGVDYNRRFSFGYQTAWALMQEGQIGPLRRMSIEVSDSLPPTAVAREPFVILTTLLCHHLDLVRWFAGEVFSIQSCFGDLQNDLLTDLVLTLRCRNGVLAVLNAGYQASRTRTKERLELFGAQGSLVVDDVTRMVTFEQGDPDTRMQFQTNPFARGDAFYETVTSHVKAFLAALVAGALPPVTGLDGWRGLELAEAAVVSHQCQQPIILPER